MTKESYLEFLSRAAHKSETITLHLDKDGGLFAGVDGVRVGIKDHEALDIVVEEIVRRVKKVDPEFNFQLNTYVS